MMFTIFIQGEALWLKQFSKSTANPPAESRTERLQGCYKPLYVHEKDALHL